MNVHDDEHEKLLEDLIAGRSPPDAERRLAECAECTRTWNELRELERRLAGAASEEEHVLSEVMASPDRHAAEEVVRRFVERVQPERRRPARWVLLTTILTAAAAVLVAVTLWRTDELPAQQDVILHGSDHLQITTRGPIRDTLEWVYDVVDTETEFEVIVRDAADPSIVVGAPKLVDETQCTWTAEELQAWPELVKIEVLATGFSKDGDSASYIGWREPR